MKVGDLVEINGSPDLGYGLVKARDKTHDLMEIDFGPGFSPYYCTPDDPEVIIVSAGTKK